MVATPLDLQKGKDFRKSFRGYNTREVDNYLAKFLRDYEQIYRQNMDLQEQLEDLKEKLNQYERIEETLQKTLVFAQETAEDVKRNAEEEASLIVEKARLHGENIVKAAERQRNELQAEYERLKQLEAAYRAQLKSFFQAQLLLLDQQLAGGEEDVPESGAIEAEPVTENADVYRAEEEVAVSVEEEERRSLGV
ncbi:MAG: DivIVA domain-containing protein [Clostridia bacterium]|nr:DivIVA domain-containing protein [Clostridia bacterium]